MSDEPRAMEIDQSVIKALLDAFDRSDWQEMTVTIGGDRLHVSRRADGAGPGPASAASRPQPAGQSTVDSPQSTEPAPAAPPAPVEAPPDGTVIESPSVGLFWRAPSPGAPPFVEMGSSVAVGDTLAIVEVMKLMNHVTAPVAGVVKAILPENGEAVQLGQPLVVIEAEA